METRIPKDQLIAGDSLTRVVLAVASGAQSIPDIVEMTGIKSTSTAHSWARVAVKKGLIRDVADELGKPRGNSFRPAIHITQLAQEFRTDAVPQ